MNVLLSRRGYTPLETIAVSAAIAAGIFAMMGAFNGAANNVVTQMGDLMEPNIGDPQLLDDAVNGDAVVGSLSGLAP